LQRTLLQELAVEELALEEPAPGLPLGQRLEVLELRVLEQARQQLEQVPVQEVEPLRLGVAPPLQLVLLQPQPLSKFCICVLHPSKNF